MEIAAKDKPGSVYFPSWKNDFYSIFLGRIKNSIQIPL